MRGLNFKPTVAATLAVALVISGCATLPAPGTPLTPAQRKKAQSDCILQAAALGTLTGALMGNVAGGNRKSTLIGAAAGALIGGAIAWGKCLAYYSDLSSFPVADARQTAMQTGWTPSRGNEVKVQKFAIEPLVAQPGGKVVLKGTYYVMAPSGTEVKVTETRIVSFFDPSTNQWKELGTIDQPVTSALGTRRAEGAFELPGNVPEGRYSIALKVTALGKSDQMSQEFMVRKS